MKSLSSMITCRIYLIWELVPNEICNLAQIITPKYMIRIVLHQLNIELLIRPNMRMEGKACSLWFSTKISAVNASERPRAVRVMVRLPQNTRGGRLGEVNCRIRARTKIEDRSMHSTEWDLNEIFISVAFFLFKIGMLRRLRCRILIGAYTLSPSRSILHCSHSFSSVAMSLARASLSEWQFTARRYVPWADLM